MLDLTGMFGKGYYGGAYKLGMMGGNSTLALILILVLGIFWVWMLVDCLKRSFKGNDKLVWVLVLLFSHIIGAAIYYFVIKAQKR